MGAAGGRRTVAVLGEMRELGAGAAEEHRAVGALAHRLGIDRGRGGRGGRRADPRRRRRGAAGRHDSPGRDRRRCGAWLRENVAGPDVVLVKASRAGRLERVADLLLEEDRAHDEERSPADDHPTQSRVELAALARDTIPRGPRMRAILLAGGLSLLLTLVGTRYAIRVLASRGYGQLIRDDGPTTHHTKRGTPTMGGLVIVLASVLAYFLATLITGSAPSASALLLLFLFVGPRHGRLPRRLHQDLAPAQPRPAQPREVHRPDVRRPGLRLPRALAVAGGRPRRRHRRGTPSPSSVTRATSRCRSIVLVLFIWLMIAGASNAVNLTDGLDGLAAGASVMTFGAYTIVNIWQNNQWCGRDGRAQVLRGARPARPRRRRRRDHRRVLRLPVVERLAGQDLHGRHRLPRPRRRARRVRRPHPHRAPARSARRPVRDPSRSR